jgi:hypothetical protein
MNSNKKFEFTPPKPQKRENETFEFIESNNSHLLLNFIIGLQMQPNNHGKNLRMEELTTHIVTNLNSNPNGNIKLFKQILDREFTYNSMEDIPENLFSENIVFYQGNYTVFPGIYGYAIEVFKNLIETIFTQKNDLPEEFIRHVFSGVTLVLELGKILSAKFHIEGNIEGAEGDSKFVYSPNEIDASFSQDDIIQICNEHQIDPEVINDFIVQPNDVGFSNSDPDKNPLLKKPIIKFEDKYYFVLISCQITSLNEFIIELSNVHNCNQKLTKLYHDKNWDDQMRACGKMGWQLTDIKLPINSHPTITNECVFQFDKNRLAYTCYLHNEEDQECFWITDFDLDNRISFVMSYLKEELSFTDYKFLSLITYENMGRDMAIGFGPPKENELRLAFSSHKFNLLCHTQKWDKLSLWKFAKSYEKFSQSTETTLIDTLDFYSIYKSKNDSFYFGDDARPNFLTVLPGSGSHLIKAAKIEKNNHGILNQINGQKVFVPSTKYAEYAPLYKPLNSLGYYALCLEAFHFPIWIVNYQVKSKSMTGQVRIFSEAIGFWLFKLKSEISLYLTSVILDFLEINLILDDKFFDDPQINDIVESNDIIDYSFSLIGNILSFSIPFSKLKTFIGSNNFGERELIRAILNSLNLVDEINFSSQTINSVIDKCIPLGRAKMILLSDSQKDPLIDNRWLLDPFYISDTEIDLLLDEIPLLVEGITEVPKNISNIDHKKELFNRTTQLLLETLIKEINIFEYEFLLHFLLELHETLVWKREYNKTLIPAQVLCFGNIRDELKEIFEKDNKLVKTSLALRCLIEYVAAKPTQGSVKISQDDIDRLLALMHEIANYGFLSDAIHFKIANPSVGKLESGRIGVSKEFFDDKLKLFAEANTKEEITTYIENFHNRFEIEEYSQDENEPKVDVALEEIDSAFLEDWGISYINISKFCYSSLIVCIDKQTSTCSMEQSEFIKQIKEKSQIDEKEIGAIIERFSITQRENYLKAPEGFMDNEVFPWKYNREFSFARRFIVKYKNNKNEIILTWGFRNAISAQKQLHYLLHEGKLNNGGIKINKLLGTFREKKGKEFRNKVKNWLLSNPNLNVIDYEVKIDKRGHLLAEKNYGDVDILVYNTETNIVYSLECKDTIKAKNIHEMKKEMDNYLGREGQKGMVQKHVERHYWLNANKEKICTFLNIDTVTKVASFMLTSEVIPTTYIKAESLPLPIISFPALKEYGTILLDTTNEKFEKSVQYK